MKCKINHNVLMLPSGKTVEFEYPIREIVEFERVIVVVLTVPPGCFMTENVFGVSYEGQIVWQIERIPETATDKGNFYAGVSAVPGDRVRLANWNDMVVEIDPLTGKVISKRQGRFT